jgi:hypothetical protein
MPSDLDHLPEVETAGLDEEHDAPLVPRELGFGRCRYSSGSWLTIPFATTLPQEGGCCVLEFAALDALALFRCEREPGLDLRHTDLPK